jgi:hypothetical protein
LERRCPTQHNIHDDPQRPNIRLGVIDPDDSFRGDIIRSLFHVDEALDIKGLSGSSVSDFQSSVVGGLEKDAFWSNTAMDDFLSMAVHHYR